MWIVYALLSAVFAALVAILAKIGMKGVDSDLATAIRTVVILIMAWVVVLIKGNINTIQSLTKHNWLFIILSAIATGLSWLCYFRALQIGKASVVAPIDKLSIAITIILAAVFLGEHLTAKEMMGGGLIVIGTLMMVL